MARKRKNLTAAERAEWEAQRARMQANIDRLREFAERGQAELDRRAERAAARRRWLTLGWLR